MFLGDMFLGDMFLENLMLAPTHNCGFLTDLTHIVVVNSRSRVWEIPTQLDKSQAFSLSQPQRVHAVSPQFRVARLCSQGRGGESNRGLVAGPR